MHIHQAVKDKSFILFIVLMAVFIGNALVAEFVGLKIFSLEKLLGSITGGKSNNVTSQAGGIDGLLRQMNGGSQSNGGFLDIVKTLAGGAQEQQQRNGGSLLDLIKGFAR